ncbi:cyclopropane-fatty-acyl-phospholipid synthase family protein [Variovorax humicola]|uniref:Cyclopropane-fatty-acyl-phospholipid synthase family protein n=1 Tax=Variovorax humicola TaxID=1769758 RepID=A0ABU8VYH4_9BURK
MNTSPTSDASPEPLAQARRAGRSLAVLWASWAGVPFRLVLRRMLRGVRCGALAVELPNGERAEGRGASAGPQASIVLHRWRPLARLLLQGDTGLAASYRDGDWSSPDLPALLEFGIRNDSAWGHALDASWPARWFGRLVHLARSNTRRGSRENIAFHYDLGNDFYAQWLDPELVYSSALHATGSESLEEAQALKLQRIVELVELKPDMSVLEIGCGWGALALALAATQGAQVTGLTLSAEQLAHARRRVAGKQLEAQIDLRLQDYRDVEGRYDRIVSIEMLEAVGERYWPTYFDTLRQRLKPDGLAVLQVITIADAHFEHYRSHTDFIQRFIFPGGMLPSPSAMNAQAERAGLTMKTTQTFGESYAITLVEWRHRFLRAWPAIEALGFDDAFRRLWEYYLCYCEAGFRAGHVDVGLYTLAHR